MLLRLYKFWDTLRTSYWFVPTVMMLCAALFAQFMLEVDVRVPLEWVEKLSWMTLNTAEGARALLSTVAGSMITVAGVVFSITMVVLTLAAGQFGPRLLRNFMRDMGNQLVLGTFTSTYLYCLLVLRRIQGGEDSSFVPHLAVTCGVVFGVLSIVVLIYFIHHVALSIQVERIIDQVTRELFDTVERLFPSDGEPRPEPDPGLDLPLTGYAEGVDVPAAGNGYIQAVNLEGLIQLARKTDRVIYLHHRTGRHLVRGAALARIWPCATVDQPMITAINDAIFLGPQPTPEQDPEFAFRQLVEVALRALSPGINDPFTAINCIDNITTGLGLLARRRFPSSYLYDDDGRLRVVAHRAGFEEIADAAFNQLRQYGAGSVAVVVRLLESIAMLAPLLEQSDQRRALLKHATLIGKAGCQACEEPADREDIESRLREARRALKAE